jgi:hypothetical protein
VYPFQVNLSENVARMLSLVNYTRLPETPDYLGVGGSLGIDLKLLKSLQNQWIYEFDW